MSTLSVKVITDVTSDSYVDTKISQVNANTANSINISYATSNAAFNTANAAYASANNVAPQVTPAYTTANLAYSTANLAYSNANTALQNTSGTFAGNLTIAGSALITGTINTTSNLVSHVTANIASPSARFALSNTSQGTYHIKSTAYGPGATNTFQYGMTFAPVTSGTQAGVLISENGSDGTAIGLFTSSSYATGPTLKCFVDPNGHLQPGTSNTYDLGSSTARWRNIYTGDLHLSNEFGNWTIVEGEDELFLYNNLKDKVYKFNITEVDKSVVPPKKGV